MRKTPGQDVAEVAHPDTANVVLLFLAVEQERRGELRAIPIRRPRCSMCFAARTDHANLFVVDAAFLPTSAAVNPSLTIAAQALRVADHIRREGFRT